jgi:hypothetical protein
VAEMVDARSTVVVIQRRTAYEHGRGDLASTI